MKQCEFLSVKSIIFLLISGIIFFSSCSGNRDNSRQGKYSPINIHLWYGNHQEFGRQGLAQRWINVLGSVESDHKLSSLQYQLNEETPDSLDWGPNTTRLARKGDFNIEILCTRLKQGINTVVIMAEDSLGNQAHEKMSLSFDPGKRWPLPYEVEWENVTRIKDAVQIVDGHWKLTDQGVRTQFPWYDRVLAVGDTTWTDYEIATSVIFHDYRPPLEGPPTYGVSHAALASRWKGHDFDENQPHVKWYPLGATCEFQIRADLDSCRWRILGGRNIRTEDTYQHFRINLGTKYFMKSQVETIQQNINRYRVKFWPATEPEPADWQLTAVEGPEDLRAGSALLIAHNTDVTFGDIKIIPLE